MLSEVLCRACVCVAIYIVVVCDGSSNVNDFEPTMKFLSGAADPKTSLALSYFLAEELRQTDGHSTPKTTFKPIKAQPLMSTKTRHISKIIDLTGSPTTVYIKNNQGRDYHRENHETPPPVPTRPIYPGQGQWAQRGVKHQPYIYGLPYNQQPIGPPNGNFKKYNENYHNHNVQHKHHKHKYNGHHHHPTTQYSGSLQNHKPHYTLNNYQLPKTPKNPKTHKSQKNYKNPGKKDKYKNHNGPKQIELIHKEKKYEKDGIEVFNRQHNYFQNRFPERIKVPESDPSANQSPQHENYKHDDDEDKDEFVPTRMYAQVRQYETESHLPASVEEPRLKKLVKDSRIHTVYMEEGYEDGGYDHAGQEKHAEEDESHVEHDNRRRRRRRSIDPSLTQVEIDTDFIGKTKYSVGEDIIEGSNKYPYYDKKGLHHNSPLRYAQDMNDIPKKKAGNMAFYEESVARTRCDDVVEKINPIPKDLDEGSETPEKTMVPKLPRLKKLGDKIDCFKVRFFGEDPLDSPFFKEEFVGQPKDPFAEEFHKTGSLIHFNRTGKSFRPSRANSARGKFEFSQIAETAFNEESPGNNGHNEAMYEVPPPNDIVNSMPEKIMKPTSDLGMAVAPIAEETMIPMSETEMYLINEAENKTEVEQVAHIEPTTTAIAPTAKETVVASASGVAVAHLNAAVEVQVNGLVDAVSNSNDAVAASSDFQPLPEAEALRMRRLTRRRKRPYHHNKLYAGRYAYRPSYKPSPSHSYPRGTLPATAAVPQPFPAQNTISEVYYKDQIKPNEQLNVFADVINHIQNMSRDDAFIAASEHHHVHVTATTRPGSINTKLRTGQRKKKRKFPVMKTTQQLYGEYVRRNKKNPSRTHEEAQIAQESNVGTVKLQQPLAQEFYNNGETPVYTTIDMPMNRFLVPGMKPPLPHEKPMIYSEYQSDNILKRQDWFTNHRLSRRKRGTRYNYSEIRRQQPARKPQEEDEEEDDDDDDDYVPHRSTNYHYDPDTDRIIYDKKPTTESIEAFIDAYLKEEPEEDPDEEEEEDEPKEKAEKKPETSTLKTIPHRTVFHKDVLNPENGKTVVDYITALKTHPSYKFIPDPTTTQEPPNTTTRKPESTTPPPFVNFLQKLHSMEGYKHIADEDPDSKKMKAKQSTTPLPVEVEEVAEEKIASAPVPVQNSPGGQFNRGGGLQIFDINDYLPKVKSYTPRTPIDYSKYKTIERTTSRHNLSSRYSEEEDELPLIRSTEQSITAKYQTALPRPKTPPPEEETDDDEEEVDDVKDLIATTPSTTTTSTTTAAATSTSKIRIRNRGRPTRRPLQTTTKSSRTTEGNETTEETEAVVYTPATHRPPSRVYPRRQRPKIRMRSTTSSPSRESDDQPEARQLNQEENSKRKTDDDDDEPTEAQSRRRPIRRLDVIVPANHKPAYTPVTISKRMDDHPIILVQRQPRLVTPEIINYNRTGSNTRPGEINPRKIAIRRKGARYIGNVDDTGRKRLINDGDLDSQLEIEKDEKVIAKVAKVDRGESNLDKNSGGNSVTVKFIKDPNKRLYFYAPL